MTRDSLGTATKASAALAGCLVGLVVVAGCSSSGAPPPDTLQPVVTEVPATPEPTPTVAFADVHKAATAKFKLTAGTYLVTYSSTAPSGGCAFSLLLEPKAGGKIVKSTISLPDVSGNAGPFEDSDTWANVPAGTYVLEEDRTGLTNCTGPWSVTLTKQ